MPLPPRQATVPSDMIAATLRAWKRDPSSDRAVLAYGLSPAPWAELSRSGGTPVRIPLPSRPHPFRDWVSFFREHLEDLVRCVAAEARLPVYVQLARGGFTLLEPRDPEFTSDSPRETMPFVRQP